MPICDSRRPDIARAGSSRRGKQGILMRIGRAALMLMLATAAQSTVAQNLVLNGSFDQNVGFWQNPDPPPATWSSLDVNASATSGSAQLRNESSVADTRLYLLRQCLIPAQTSQYRVEVAALVSPQNTGGRLVVSRIDHSSADCSGGATGFSGYFVDTSAAWQRTGGEIPSQIAAGSSIELLIGVEKDAAGGSFVAYVDDVRLVPSPLFVSGFE